MSVTGTQVSDRINLIFSDSGATTKWSNAQKLEAINMAIDDAWPTIKAVSLDSSKTIASGTDSYSPTATPEVEWGFSEAYVTNGSYPDVLLRRVTQRQSGTTWTVYIPDDLTYAYDGETLKLRYNTRIARITALTDSIELPLNYLWKATSYYLCLMLMATGANFDVAVFEKLVAQYEKEKEMEKRRVARGNLVQYITTVSEFGEGKAYDPNRGRYRV